ncbi:MAG: VOC family protein [Chromatiales bacterium]|jgi:catechol 2,3-dioxygenase-like lactoylglutathione lyase family enzyme|nr:VOC family protein [Chromatiales bacterium]
MIGYVTLGTNDAQRSIAFYDALLAPLGVKRVSPNDRITLWSVAKGQPMLGIAVPFDGQPASSGNGAMVAVNVGSKATVDTMHASALGLGATDDGAPGPRGGGPFYGGYIRDPDGNKLALFCLDG